MRKLDIDTQSGGRGGVRTRLQNQMQRFFNAQVRVVYQDEHREQFMSSAIADRGEFWWSERKSDEPVLWESKIRLGEDFFGEIIAHPVPLDMNTLKEPQPVAGRSRPVRVAGLPDVQPRYSEAVVLADDLPAVRGEPDQGERQANG